VLRGNPRQPQPVAPDAAPRPIPARICDRPGRRQFAVSAFDCANPTAAAEDFSGRPGLFRQFRFVRYVELAGLNRACLLGLRTSQ
jgi:hypothetical protein